MNNVDYDKTKFDKDPYGNLIPKDGYSAGETYGKDVIPDVEEDAEIKKEYTIELNGIDVDYCKLSFSKIPDTEIYRPHRSN